MTEVRKGRPGMPDYVTMLPAPIKHGYGTADRIVRWYDQNTRDWVVALHDEVGQVGNSIRVYSAQEAKDEVHGLFGQAVIYGKVSL